MDGEEQAHLLTMAKELLERADRAWSTITGQLTIYNAEDVLEEGLARYGEGRETDDAWDGEGEDLDEGDEVDSYQVEVVYRFWVAANPWRLRLERIHQVLEPSNGEEDVPFLLIIDRRTWWTVYRGEVATGGVTPDRLIVGFGGKTRWAVYGDEIIPDPDDWHSTPDGHDLDPLLKPSRLASTLQFLEATRVEVEQRPAIRVRATPVPGDDFFMEAPGLVVMAADEYVLSIDAVYGVVLAFEVYIDGQVARRHALSDVEVNRHIDNSLFGAPSGESAPSRQVLP